jgi:transposase InsO family protein
LKTTFDGTPRNWLPPERTDQACITGLAGSQPFGLRVCGAASSTSGLRVHFPNKAHTLVTDNGSEFTDRFAVDMKGKPEGHPSGNHPKVRREAGIDHRLTKPYKPQTNGLVERFNRRIAEAIGRQTKRGTGHRLFASHADRNAFLKRFVEDDNHTRLKCLDYQAPNEILTKLTGPNTKAGITKVR